MYNFLELNKKIKELNFNGALTITKNHSPIFAEGFGYSDIKSLRKNTPDTPMRIASITKTITAVAILKLYEDGKIHIHDKVNKYIDDFLYDEITIHHLLSNSSGIANFPLDYDFSDILNSSNILKSLIDMFKNNPLQFKPGSRFGYSVSGYLILQYILEKVSGLTYYDYLKKNIFDVLDMSNTYFEHPDLVIENRAKPYNYADNTLKEVDFFDMRIAGAGGGLISSSNDLSKFAKALMSNQIISKESVSKLFDKHVKVTEYDYYCYGMILSINSDYGKERRIYYHPGGGLGVRSIHTFFPDDDLYLSLIANSGDKDTFKGVREILYKFLLDI